MAAKIPKGTRKEEYFRKHCIFNGQYIHVTIVM